MLAKMASKSVMLQGTTTRPEIRTSTLDNSAKAVRRRALSKKLKEKKREDSFVNRYVQLKYPDIYNEIKESYSMFAKKYPSRCDLTKTYFFKKWEKCVNMKPATLYVPHLPILIKEKQLTNSQPKEMSPPRTDLDSEVPSPRQEFDSEVPPPRHELDSEVPSPQQELVNEVPPPRQELDSEFQSPRTDLDSEVPSPRQELVNENTTPRPEVASEIPPLVDDPCMGMTLDEMAIAAEEIIMSLQSDRNLIDIMENFEFPEATWNNDLVLTDYVLETDGDW